MTNFNRTIKQSVSQLLHHLSRNERGQGIVELAIVLPLMMVVLMGVIDFGRVMHAYTVVVNGSREAALVGAATSTTDADLRQIVLDEVARGNAAGGPTTVTVSYALVGLPPRRTITIDTSHVINLTLPLMTDRSITVRNQAVMMTFWN